jgi:hypothetical protein
MSCRLLATNKNKIDLTILSSSQANKYSTPISCRIVFKTTPQQEEEKKGNAWSSWKCTSHIRPLRPASIDHYFLLLQDRGRRYFMMASTRLHRASSHTLVSMRSFHRYLSFAIYCVIVFQPIFSQAWEKRQTTHGKSVIAYYAR